MKKSLLATALIFGMILLLTIFSTQAKDGAREGLAMCENIIIPSLLPILILTNIIIKSKCSEVFNRIFSKIFVNVFKLPPCSATAVILGLIGGYPAGAVLTSHLYKEGLITSKQAQRIMNFNFCGGVAFIITAVGTVCFSSTKIGVILYIINILSSIIIALIGSAFTKEKPTNDAKQINHLTLSDALVASVETTIKSILNMCSYIILFSAITAIINLPEYLNPIIEITNGICNREEFMPLQFCAFFLSFGGFCIHFQIIGILREMGVKYTNFLIFRIAGALLSFAITLVYLHLFPQSASVFSNLSSTTSQLTQVNAGLSIVLIIGCAVIILDIENKKSKLL